MVGGGEFGDEDRVDGDGDDDEKGINEEEID